MKLVDKGQTRGPLAKRQVSAALVFNHGARKLRSMPAGKLDDGGAVVELAAAIRYLKLILVVIMTFALQLNLRGLRAGGVHVNGRLLLEEVVTVGGCGLKVGNRVAQVLVATPLIGIEGNGLGALLASRIFLDVPPQRLVRGEQVLARDVLNARSVLHADGLYIADLKRALGLVNVKFAQRDQRRGDLDLYDVALLGIALRGALDGDDKIRSFASKGVVVDITLGGLFRILKRRAVVFDFGKVVNLHKVAQLIGKRDVAGLMLAIAVVHLGRIANDLSDALGDVLKDVLELLGVFRRFVVIGVFCARTKVDGPSGPVRNAGRGGRIVARHGVHELILFNRTGGRGVGAGIRAAKDTNGVNDGAVFLQAVCLVDGAIGNRGFKATGARGRAIGKEQDDLLGIFAVRGDAFGKFHAIVGTRGTGRPDGADHALKVVYVIARARRQAHHGLRIVVSVAAFTISVVADLTSLIARELYDGDLVPLGLVRDLCIFFGDLFDKAIGRGLQRVNTLGTVA